MEGRLKRSETMNDLRDKALEHRLAYKIKTAKKRQTTKTQAFTELHTIWDNFKGEAGPHKQDLRVLH